MKKSTLAALAAAAAFIFTPVTNSGAENSRRHQNGGNLFNDPTISSHNCTEENGFVSGRWTIKPKNGAWQIFVQAKRTESEKVDIEIHMGNLTASEADLTRTQRTLLSALSEAATELAESTIRAIDKKCRQPGMPQSQTKFRHQYTWRNPVI